MRLLTTVSLIDYILKFSLFNILGRKLAFKLALSRSTVGRDLQDLVSAELESDSSTRTLTNHCALLVDVHNQPTNQTEHW